MSVEHVLPHKIKTTKVQMQERNSLNIGKTITKNKDSL